MTLRIKLYFRVSLVFSLHTSLPFTIFFADLLTACTPESKINKNCNLHSKAMNTYISKHLGVPFHDGLTEDRMSEYTGAALENY